MHRQLSSSPLFESDSASDDHTVRETASAMVIWRFSDGKPGHDNQSLGLVNALGSLRSVTVFDVPAPPARTALLAWLSGRWPQTPGPPPVLLVGAGHGTHLALLAARRCTGARAVVLMRPTLPLSWFDLCVIPAHDHPPERSNVLVTRGVLNRIRPGTPDPHCGLVLVGGPSRHFVWDETLLLRQIDTVVGADRNVNWTVATSRRTPAAFERRLQRQASSQMAVVPASSTDRDWLPRALASSGRVWVTMDSVSMVYEALTAGVAVGLLELGRTQSSRLSGGLEQLCNDGWVVTFSDWRAGTPLGRPGRAFDEAARCARWVVDAWAL